MPVSAEDLVKEFSIVPGQEPSGSPAPFPTPLETPLAPVQPQRGPTAEDLTREFGPQPEGALRAVQGISPDQAAKARQHGLPVDSEAEIVNQAERQKALSELPPSTRTWLSDPTNAAVANSVPDFFSLAEVENIVRGWGDRELDRLAGGLAILGVIPATPEAIDETAASLRKQSLGFKGRDVRLRDVLDAPISKVAPWIVEQQALSLPDMALAWFASPLFLATETGRIAQNRAERDGRDEINLTDILYAVPGAAANTFLERFGIRAILGVGEPALKAGLTEAAKRIVKAGGTEAATEAIEEGTEEAVTGLGTQQGTSVAAIIENAILGGLAGAGGGGGIRTGVEVFSRITGNISKAQQAVKDQEILQTMRDAVGASKLYQRDPELAAEHLTQAMHDVGVREVYIDGPALRDWLRRGDNPERTSVLLGVSEQIHEADVLGTQVTISADKYNKYILNDPRGAELDPFVKLEEDGMTPTEAQEYTASGLQEDIQEIQEDISPKVEFQHKFNTDDTNIIIDGNLVGTIQYSVSLDGKTLTIKEITGASEDHKIGHAQLRAILKELQARFPELEKVVGNRITGAFQSVHEVNIPNPEQDVTETVQQKFGISPELSDAERDMALRGLFNSANEAGMTDKQFEKYAKSQEDARNEAQRRVKDKELAAKQRELTDEWKKAKQDMTDLVRDELSQLPVYQVQGADRKKNPEALAELYGYENAEEMELDIATSPTLKESVALEVDRRMRQKYGDLLDAKNRIINARAALVNEPMESMLAQELEVMGKKAGINRNLRQSLIRTSARDRISRMTVKDINSFKFHNAVKKYGKEAGKAWGKGDYATAEQMKFQQLLNFRMLMETERVKARIEKYSNYLKKFVKRRGSKTLLTNPNIEQIQKKIVDLGTNPTYGQLRETYEDVRALHHDGVTQTKLSRAQERERVGEIVTLIENGIINNLGPKRDSKAVEIERTKWTTFKHYARQLRMPFVHADTILTGIDGEEFGPVYRETKGRYDIAMAKGYMPGQKGYLRRQQEIAKKLNKFYSVFTKKEQADFRKTFRVPGVNKPISHQAILMILFNSRNDGNLNRLIDGGPFTSSEIQTIHDYASAKDIKFVNDVGDYIESFWPEIKASETRRKNVVPEAVTGEDRQLKNGTLKGGYFPIVYDPEKTAFRQMDYKDFFDVTKFANPAASQTKRGHLEERKGRAEGPLLRDLGIIYTHLNNVVRDLEMGDALRDIYNVLHYNGTKDIPSTRARFIEQGYGHHWEMLDLWLRDVVLDEQVPVDAVSQGFRRARTGLTVAKLGYSLVTSLKQPLGIIQTSVLVGKRNMMKGLMTYMQHPVSSFKTVRELSPYMAARTNTWNKEIMDARARIHRNFVDKVTPGDTAQFIRDNYFTWVSKLQAFSDIVSWIAAYNKGIKQYPTQQEAIDYADRIVTRTQASGIFGERTAIERGSLSKGQQQSEVTRSFTAFASYYLAKFNVAQMRYRRVNKYSPLSHLNYMTDMALLFAGEAFFFSLLSAAVSGDWGDDEESFGDRVAKQTGYELLGTIPLVREVGSARFGTQGGVVGIAGADIYRLSSDIWDTVTTGELDKQLGRDAASVFGTWTRTPTMQIERFFKEIQKENPTVEDILLGQVGIRHDNR